MRYAFDADVLIYAVNPAEPLGDAVRSLRLHLPPDQLWGSVLLLPELLAKPVREARHEEVEVLLDLLSGLSLLDVSQPLASLAAALAATYRLRAADAVHLASAVSCGADAFVTNNHKDFRAGDIQEITVLHPQDL